MAGPGARLPVRRGGGLTKAQADGAYVAFVTGLTADGVTDNYAVIAAAATAAPAGSVLILPAGKIALSQSLTLPEGLTLRGSGCVPDKTAEGTVLMPTSGSSGTNLLDLQNGYTSLEDLTVWIPGAQAWATAVNCNAYNPKFRRCWIVGGTSFAFVASALAGNMELSGVKISANGSGSVLNTVAPDVLATGVRTSGQLAILSGSGQWSACHFVNATGSGQNVRISGRHDFAACMFDSSSFLGVIQHSSGNATLTGCKLYQNAGISSLPAIKEGSSTDGLTLTGCIVLANPAAGANRFTSIIDAPNAFTTVNGLTVEAGAVVNSGATATIYGSGLPAWSTAVVYNGNLQTNVGSGRTLAAIKKVLSPLPSASSATYGAAVALSLPAGTVGLDVQTMFWVPGGVSGETVQLLFTITFSDATTQTLTVSAVGNLGTQNPANSGLANFTKDGLYVTGVTVQAQSTIASSTAAPTATIVAIPAA